MGKRRIFIISERRADYARFKPILELLRKDPFFEYQLVVTGISLLKRHGEDINVIRQDGFEITAVVPMFEDEAPDTGAEMVRALARVCRGLADEIERLKPDLILAGFDIGANFAAAVAGAHMNIPVAHIQGGEVTGSIDESLRHAMTKFAHIHFPANQAAAARLIRMGEDPRFIFPVGCPSLDVVIETPPVPRKALAAEFGLDLSRPYVVILQHPVTTEHGSAGPQIVETLEAVRDLKLQAILIYPNNDAGHKAIIDYVRDSQIHHIPSLPVEKYVNLVRYAGALVGNSSSGIHETASLHVPTVNVGTRQAGRERPRNVIDVGYSRREIKTAIRTALEDEAFKEVVRTCANPYGDGHAAERIVKVLRELDLAAVPIQKIFKD